MMTTLNGLPRSQDSFIQGICARKKLIKFSRLCEECTQEEARLVSREEKMGASDDQALTSRAKKNEGKREDHSHRRPKKFQKNHRPRRDYTNLRCYTCDEKGHFSRYFPRNKGSSKEKKGIMLTLLKMMNQPRKEQGRIPQVMKNMYFDLE